MATTKVAKNLVKTNNNNNNTIVNDAFDPLFNKYVRKRLYKKYKVPIFAETVGYLEGMRNAIIPPKGTILGPVGGVLGFVGRTIDKIEDPLLGIPYEIAVNHSINPLKAPWEILRHDQDYTGKNFIQAVSGDFIKEKHLDNTLGNILGYGAEVMVQPHTLGRHFAARDMSKTAAVFNSWQKVEDAIKPVVWNAALPGSTAMLKHAKGQLSRFGKMMHPVTNNIYDAPFNTENLVGNAVPKLAPDTEDIITSKIDANDLPKSPAPKEPFVRNYEYTDAFNEYKDPRFPLEKNITPEAPKVLPNDPNIQPSDEELARMLNSNDMQAVSNAPNTTNAKITAIINDEQIKTKLTLQERVNKTMLQPWLQEVIDYTGQDASVVRQAVTEYLQNGGTEEDFERLVVSRFNSQLAQETQEKIAKVHQNEAVARVLSTQQKTEQFINKHKHLGLVKSNNWNPYAVSRIFETIPDITVEQLDEVLMSEIAAKQSGLISSAVPIQGTSTTKAIRAIRHYNGRYGTFELPDGIQFEDVVEYFESHPETTLDEFEDIMTHSSLYNSNSPEVFDVVGAKEADNANLYAPEPYTLTANMDELVEVLKEKQISSQTEILNQANRIKNYNLNQPSDSAMYADLDTYDELRNILMRAYSPEELKKNRDPYKNAASMLLFKYGPEKEYPGDSLIEVIADAFRRVDQDITDPAALDILTQQSKKLIQEQADIKNIARTSKLEQELAEDKKKLSVAREKYNKFIEENPLFVTKGDVSKDIHEKGNTLLRENNILYTDVQEKERALKRLKNPDRSEAILKELKDLEMQKKQIKQGIQRKEAYENLKNQIEEIDIEIGKIRNKNYEDAYKPLEALNGKKYNKETGAPLASDVIRKMKEQDAKALTQLEEKRSALQRSMYLYANPAIQDIIDATEGSPILSSLQGDDELIKALRGTSKVKPLEVAKGKVSFDARDPYAPIINAIKKEGVLMPFIEELTGSDLEEMRAGAFKMSRASAVDEVSSMKRMFEQQGISKSSSPMPEEVVQELSEMAKAGNKKAGYVLNAITGVYKSDINKLDILTNKKYFNEVKLVAPYVYDIYEDPTILENLINFKAEKSANFQMENLLTGISNLKNASLDQPEKYSRAIDNVYDIFIKRKYGASGELNSKISKVQEQLVALNDVGDVSQDLSLNMKSAFQKATSNLSQKALYNEDIFKKEINNLTRNLDEEKMLAKKLNVPLSKIPNTGIPLESIHVRKRKFIGQNGQPYERIVSFSIRPKDAVNISDEVKKKFTALRSDSGDLYGGLINRYKEELANPTEAFKERVQKELKSIDYITEQARLAPGKVTSLVKEHAEETMGNEFDGMVEATSENNNKFSPYDVKPHRSVRDIALESGQKWQDISERNHNSALRSEIEKHTNDLSQTIARKNLNSSKIYHDLDKGTDKIVSGKYFGRSFLASNGNIITYNNAQTKNILQARATQLNKMIGEGFVKVTELQDGKLLRLSINTKHKKVDKYIDKFARKISSGAFDNLDDMILFKGDPYKIKNIDKDVLMHLEKATAIREKFLTQAGALHLTGNKFYVPRTIGQYDFDVEDMTLKRTANGILDLTEDVQQAIVQASYKYGLNDSLNAFEPTSAFYINADDVRKYAKISYREDIAQNYGLMLSRHIYDNMYTDNLLGNLLDDTNSFKQLRIDDIQKFRKAIEGNESFIKIYAPKYNEAGVLVKLQEYNPFSDKALKEAITDNAYINISPVFAKTNSILQNRSKFSTHAGRWIHNNITVPFKIGAIQNVGFALNNDLDNFSKIMVMDDDTTKTIFNKAKGATKDMFYAYKAQMDYESLMTQFREHVKNLMEESPKEASNMSFSQFLNMEGIKDVTDEQKINAMLYMDFKKSLAYTGETKILKTGLEASLDKDSTIKPTLLQRVLYGGEKQVYKKGQRLGAMKEYGLLMNNPVSDKLLDMASDHEEIARFAIYSKKFRKLGKGIDYDTFEKFVKSYSPQVTEEKLRGAFAALEAQFDYNNMTPTMIRMNKFIPFTTFFTRNIAFWTQYLYDNPNFTQNLYKFQTSMWANEELNDTKQGIAQGGNIPVSKNLLTKISPTKSALGAVSTMQHPLQSLSARIHPLAKVPVAAFISKDQAGYRPYSTNLYERKLKPGDKGYNYAHAALHNANLREQTLQNALKFKGNPNVQNAASMMSSVFAPNYRVNQKKG